MLQRPAPIANDRGEPRTILGSNDNADFLCHAPTIAHLAYSILCLHQRTSGCDRSRRFGGIALSSGPNHTVTTGLRHREPRAIGVPEKSRTAEEICSLAPPKPFRGRHIK
jgi:hypothetical protein